jgi:hypothetical protein
MSILKQSLHISITLASFAGFLAGWASLAQAARQTANSSSANLQASVSLPPIQSVDNLLHTISSDPNTTQSYKINPATPTPLPQPTIQPQQPQLFFFAPPVRTKGS